MTEPDKLRVLLVDDQELVRYGFRLVLEAEDDIVVVGEASDGAEGVREAARLKPDVVLMDIRMPTMSGIEATQQIFDIVPSTRVLVLTTYDNDEYAFAALRAGAAGFLLKNTRPAELVSAVRTIVAGDSVVSPRMTAQLIQVAVNHVDQPVDDAAQRELAELSDRERDVFLLVARGLSNAEVAHELNLSESTVKAHFGRLLVKLDVANRVQVVIRAYELGIVSA